MSPKSLIITVYYVSQTESGTLRKEGDKAFPSWNKGVTVTTVSNTKWKWQGL